MEFGIISLGNHALTRMIPAIRSSGSSVTHIYSTDKSKGERVSRELGAEYFNDLDRFMRGTFEAVYISSPNSLHYANTKLSLQADKSVLLEKPATLKIQDTKELAELSRKENLRLGIGFHLRFHPATEEVKRYVDNNEIGESIVAFGKFTSNSVSTHDGTWWSDPLMAGGGSIVGRGVHVMDSFVNLFGRDVISLRATNVPKCSVLEDTMQVSIEFGNGVLANSLSSRTISPSSNDLVIYGREGSITVTNFYSTSVSSKLYLNNELKAEYDGKTNMYEEEVKDFTGNWKRIAGPDEAILSTKMHVYSQESACSGRTVNFAKG